MKASMGVFRGGQGGCYSYPLADKFFLKKGHVFVKMFFLLAKNGVLPTMILFLFFRFTPFRISFEYALENPNPRILF